MPRAFITFECQFDQYSNEYCPEALASAEEYWDFEDGWSVTMVGSVVDFASKEKQFRCPSNNYLLASKYYDSCRNCIDRTYYEVRCSTNGTVTVRHEFRLKSNNTYNGGRLVQSYNQTNIGSNIGSTYLGNIGQGCNYRVYYSRSCDGTNCSYNFNINSNCNGSSYRTSAIAPIPYKLTCPSGYIDNGSNCEKTISYNYFEYLCKDEENVQGENFTPAITTTYQPKTDPNLTEVNESILDDTLGAVTPPIDNCKRVGFTCNSNYRNPAWVDGAWKCSVYNCNNEHYCGYATCDGLTPSLVHIMPYFVLPISSLERNVAPCYSQLCPLVSNDQISYCESSQCPQGFGVFEEDGKCLLKECPEGTSKSADDKCYDQ